MTQETIDNLLYDFNFFVSSTKALEDHDLQYPPTVQGYIDFCNACGVALTHQEAAWLEANHG